MKGTLTEDSTESDFLDRYRKFAELGVELFRDELSETSRKRQASLLVVSVVAILLAYGTLHVPDNGEVSAFGFKFTVSSAMTVKRIFGVLSVYFSLSYLISLLQDLKASEYRRAPLLAYVQQLAGETIQWIHLRAEKYELAMKCVDLLKKLTRMRQQYEEEEERKRAQVRELASQIDAGVTGMALFNEYRKAVQGRDALEARHEKDEQPVQQELTQCRTRIAELMAAEQGPLKEPVKGELDQYVSMYETYRTYGIYRFGLEGLLPLVLGAFASWVGLLQ